MLVWEDSRFPQDVEDLARRVDRWRRKRVGRARMPENLWAEALEVASKWGPYQAARVLGLCYSTVKRRLEAQGPFLDDIPEASAAPAFIEILNPMKGGQVAGCVLEVQTLSGNRLRLEMKEVSAPDLLTVLRGLVA